MKFAFSRIACLEEVKNLTQEENICLDRQTSTGRINGYVYKRTCKKQIYKHIYKMSSLNSAQPKTYLPGLSTLLPR